MRTASNDYLAFQGAVWDSKAIGRPQPMGILLELTSAQVHDFPFSFYETPRTVTGLLETYHRGTGVINSLPISGHPSPHRCVSTGPL